MRLVVDTGVFSAALSPRRRASYDRPVGGLAGNQIFLAAPTVAELRYGALVAGWGAPRRDRLEVAIGATTVVPVTDTFLTRVAELRFACRALAIRSQIGLMAMTCGSLQLRFTSKRRSSRPT